MTQRNTAFWNTVVSAVIGDLRDICNVVKNLHFISPFQHFIIFSSAAVTLLFKRKWVCIRLCWITTNQVQGQLSDYSDQPACLTAGYWDLMGFDGRRGNRFFLLHNVSRACDQSTPFWRRQNSYGADHSSCLYICMAWSLIKHRCNITFAAALSVRCGHDTFGFLKDEV